MCCLICLLSVMTLQAQPPQYAFRIYFKDKAGSPPVSSPLSFLSQRALDRRTAQGISIDSTDRPVSPNYISNVLSLTGGKLHVTSRWLNYCVLLLEDSSDMLSLAGLPYIDSTKYISYYSPGLHKSSNITNDKFANEFSVPLGQQPLGSSAYYGAAYTQTKMVNGDYLHDMGYKGEGMLIAVLDEAFTGTDNGPGFDSMRINNRVKDQFNFSEANSNILLNEGSVTSTHGTKSLSTIAANIPGTFVGAAPNAEYALYCTEIISSEQYMEMDNLMAAAERSDSIGADIITVSLGYNDFSGRASPALVYADIDGKSTIAAKAANIATTKGMLFVASAGNDGAGGWHYILTPGDADSAITIGNVTQNGSPALTSGHGPNAAGRPKPDVCMLGQSATVMDGTATPFGQQGTSFATPQLAGWAACLWQARGKSIKPYQLRDAINKTATLYPDHYDQNGYGVPDFQQAYIMLGVKDTPQSSGANWVTAVNPFSRQINLKLYQVAGGNVAFKLVNMGGCEIANWNKHVSNGSQNIDLDVPEIPAGIYFITTETSTATKTIKLFKY